jgi:hypothetical protein
MPPWIALLRLAAPSKISNDCERSPRKRASFYPVPRLAREGGRPTFKFQKEPSQPLPSGPVFETGERATLKLEGE